MRMEIKPEPWTDAHDAEILTAFSGKTLRKTDTSGGLRPTTEYLRNGGVFCRVYRDGEPVMWYVAIAHRYLDAIEVEVALAHGRADCDLVAEVMPLIEWQCREADSIRVTTCRRGMVRKLQRLGYRSDAVLMRKRMGKDHG
ncbi:hypothetical protein DFLDMN_000722 [Cupriavidus sp. H19C3]|uniref:hypothetical protein n=1 Tax=Cupriavidus sp. H19C3 TaxID=3241603 RepID=UPI003BF7DC69